MSSSPRACYLHMPASVSNRSCRVKVRAFEIEAVETVSPTASMTPASRAKIGQGGRRPELVGEVEQCRADRLRTAYAQCASSPAQRARSSGRIKRGHLGQQRTVVHAGVREMIFASQHIAEFVVQTHGGAAKSLIRQVRHPVGVLVRGLQVVGLADSAR
jgi:hypothetical protein